MKVNKEELLGMMVAVEMYLKRDAEAEWKEWERRAKLLTDSVAKIPAVKTGTRKIRKRPKQPRTFNNLKTESSNWSKRSRS